METYGEDMELKSREPASDSSKAQAKGIPTGIYKETGVEVKGNMITGNGNGIRLLSS